MIVSAIVILLLLCFAGVLLVGAPYLPTLTPQVRTALRLAQLRPGQTLLELGCGDGKVLIAAAKQGNRAIGYELNPLLAVLAWLRTRRYRHLVTVRCANFWNVQWPPADVIFVFLLPRYMKRLDTAIQAYDNKPVRLISFAFAVPAKKIDAEADGVFVYDY